MISFTFEKQKPMSPNEIYEKRINDFRIQSDSLQKRENHLSLARLITFFSGFALFILLFSTSITVAIAALLTGLIAFVWLVTLHLKTVKLKEYYRYLETINTLELKCIGGDFFSYPDGAEFTDRNHPNSYDLDLFGHASLFQYINRTKSKPASELLAQWLKEPATEDEISLRQSAIEELKPMIDWRQDLITLGYNSKGAGNDPETLLSWVRGENFFFSHRHVIFISYGLSAFGIISTILAIAGLPAGLLALALTINFIFYFSQGKRISKLHQQVTRSSDMLQTYAEIIELIENGSFSSNKLRELQYNFRGGTPVSSRIKRLSRLVNRLDTRLNILVSIPLNLFFFWDIHCCFALEKWNISHSGEIARWFSTMAEFEVLSSFGNMAFNNPDWIKPEIVSEYFVFRSENMGHPLIPSQRRIGNNIEIPERGKAVIVTGSNMSGKSTFLRTCGINAVLALAGAPVCASSFKISHVEVFSSMRISDSLEDNTSSFYYELKRLAAIIKEAEHNPKVFLLLDEILRGTNSNDRFTGSVALIRQLIGYETVAIVATHDLKLAELSVTLPGRIDNYHFDVKIDGEELYFDYKLTPGICKSLNASILMKKMGIRV